MIKIFVGTCPKNKKAEEVLEYSIKKHTSELFEIIWMREGEGIFIDWEKKGWGTNFTPFRWTIPILTNWTGKAIYLDVDVLLRDDISNLWNIDMEDKAIVSLLGNYSVMLMNCEKLTYLPYEISSFKQYSCDPPYHGVINTCISLIEDNNDVKKLDPKWNCLDGKNIDWHYASLIHYSNKKTQPWKPYSEKHEYKPHEKPELEELWYQYYRDSR